MSAGKVYVKQDYGFVGWRGQSVRLNAGTEYAADHPMVHDMPHLFTADKPDGALAEDKPAPRRRGGRRG